MIHRYLESDSWTFWSQIAIFRARAVLSHGVVWSQQHLGLLSGVLLVPFSSFEGRGIAREDAPWGLVLPSCLAACSLLDTCRDVDDKAASVIRLPVWRVMPC